MKSLPYFLSLFLLTACQLEKIGPFKVQSLITDEVNFVAIFDESAIYTSVIDENQYDVNKLLGFSDCSSQHHEHSARFGWRWLDDDLEILAYCYVSGERIVEYVGSVELNQESTYQIRLENDSYVFQLDHYPEVVIQRDKPCDKGFYYMLWPYFGGDETAPHNIEIQISLRY
jgi:hypothetical protein